MSERYDNANDTNATSVNDGSLDSISTEDTSTGPEVPFVPTPLATTSMVVTTGMTTNTSNETDEETNTSSVIEICGLNESSNGRNCIDHICCGENVVINDVLRLKKCVVDVDGGFEEAIKLVKIAGGSETCMVGFLQNIYCNLPKVQ
jgi:hypothetical protein